MKVEISNFAICGIDLAERDYLQENEQEDEQDDREEEAYVNGYYSNDFGLGYRYGIC